MGGLGLEDLRVVENQGFRFKAFGLLGIGFGVQARSCLLEMSVKYASGSRLSLKYLRRITLHPKP